MKKPKYLAKRRYCANRIMALLMLVSMLMTMFDFSAFSIEENTTEYSNTLDEWSVQALWGNNSSDFVCDSDKNEDIPFTLTFSYFLNGASRDYNANEVKFKVKGIGDIKRNGKIIAETTTTQVDSDWDLKYDSTNDEYTFIYKRAIPQHQMLSGGFQMQWKVNSRNAINGYTYTSSPVFSITDGTDEKSINMKPLTLEYTSQRDQYKISLQPEKLTGLEYEKVEDGKEDKDYIWYDYVTTVGNVMKARGIYKSDYFVEIVIPEGITYDKVKAATTSNTPIDIVEIKDPATGNTVHGFYLFQNKYGDVSNNNDNCTFRLGFDKTMEGQSVTINTRLVPLFNDESQKVTVSTPPYEILNATHTWKIVNYSFTYDSYNYSQGKFRADGNSAIIVNDIYNGRTVEFRLKAQTSRNYSSSSSAANVYTDKDKHPTQYQTFDLIQGDDYIVVRTNDGNIRELDASEYDFEYVKIPSDIYNYDYEVYISKEKDLSFEQYIQCASGNTSTEQTVRFEKGVKAMYVKIMGVSGSYVSNIYPAVNFHFDWESEQTKPTAEQINPNGNIANFCLLRLVKTDDDNTKVNFAATDGNNYIGIGIEGLKNRDMNLYNEYLYREVVDVNLRSAATSINSATEIDKFQKGSGGDYNSTVKSTGKIQSDEDGKLKKFSVYTVLQKGLNVKETLDGISVSGSATGVNGKAVTDSMFNENVSYELKIDSTGRWIVVCNFDFSDNPIESSKETKVTVNFPAYVAAATYISTGVRVYSAETYTMVHDEGILKFIGNNLVRDVYDLDGDGNKSEYTAKSSANRTIGSTIIEWLDAAEKYVKTATTQSYVHGLESENVRVDSYSTNPDVDQNKSYYSYRLDLSAGDNAIKDIVVFDNIEPSSKTVQLSGNDVQMTSEWHGTLKSVDTSQPDGLGIISTVYCSESEDQEYTLDINDPSANGWTRMNNNGSIWTAPDNMEVRTIAIAYDTTKMSDDNIEGTVQNRLIYSVVNMQAPEITNENINIVDTSAQNNFDVQYRVSYNADFIPHTLQSAITTISIDQSSPEFEIKKYDAQTNATLMGAKFSVYEDKECTIAVDGLTDISVNNLGKFVGRLPAYNTYYIKETQAPTGYKLRTDVIEFTADKSYNIVEIFNERLTGTLNFKKKDSDNKDIDNLAGAEYQLYTFDGTKIFTDESNAYSTTGTKDTFVTGENGFTVTGLPWGNYYLVETKAPDGYELNDQKVNFTISKSGTVTDGAITVDASQADDEKTATLMLTKTDEMTGDRLKNAWYKVQKKVNGEWEDTTLPYSSTNAYGELRIEDVKFGEYRFVEINAPIGYEINSDTLNPKSVVLDASTVGQTIEFTHSDQRKTGSINLTKYSDTGAYLANARFDLYMIVGEKDGDSAPENDPADQLVRKGLVTDSNGKIPTVDSLDWGKYYFVETYAPTGYKKENAVFLPETVEIIAENVEVVQDVEVTDKQIRGSVKLTKYGEDSDAEGGKRLLPNAVFVLCDKDGKQLKIKDNGNGSYSYDETSTAVELTTDSNGEITISNIPWGAYYFEEITAPTGYALADKVRFTVNANNCLSVQELECYNSLVKCQLTVEKEIDEALSQFGDPTFIFKIKGENQEWLRTIQLNGEKKSGSFTLSVNPGTYTVEEIRVSRYTLTSLETVDKDATTTVDTDISTRTATVVFSTTEQTDTKQFATLKFTNTLNNYDKFNHVVGVNNIIPVQKQITGISVVYNGDLIPVGSDESSYTIPKDELTAKIIYDDGSEEVITDMDNLTPTGSDTDFIVDNSVNNASSEIELNAQYTTGGKTYTTKFYVTIAPLVVMPVQKVVYRVDSGNESYFDKDGKSTTANVVYYSDGAKMSGSYVEPETLDEIKMFGYWTDENGNEFLSEQEVIDYLKNNTDILSLTLTAELTDSTKDFAYTGDIQTFTAPISGYYQLETWGAQGGGSVASKTNTYPNGGLNDPDVVPVEGGRGGYSTATVYLEKDQMVYIAVGGKGMEVYGSYGDTNIIAGGYNGGGLAKYSTNHSDIYNGGGGGATHIALTKQGDGQLANYESYNDDVLVVAGGGGGSGYYQNTKQTQFSHHGLGGAGGGLESQGNHDNGSKSHGTSTVKGSTQTASGTGTNNSSVGSFGQGASYDTKEPYGSGGGGGWYGGSSTELQGGAGGSGHIGTGTVNGETIAGTETFLAPDGTEETGHTGNGYARITYLPYIDFNYTGDIQTYTAPVSGYYKMECWGAQGGGSKTYGDGNYSSSRLGFSDPGIVDVEGGRGGYTTANVYLTKGQTVYIAVGGMGQELYSYQGKSTDYIIENGLGFNGGGGVSSSDHQGDYYAGGGGGATHIALTLQGDGQLANYESYQDDVLVVAGGGGGSGFYHHYCQIYLHYGLGGAGGGLVSEGNHDNGSLFFPTVNVGGSTQTDSATGSDARYFVKGSFGQGGKRSSSGGGGWYGGSAASSQGSAGGSGHIGTSTVNGETIAGTETFLAPDGTEETGHTGNGCARVTYIGKSA